jgi:RND superfamily putative drug exporter
MNQRRSLLFDRWPRYERGHAKTFRVVIAAGLIMRSVFFASILTDARVIKGFGLGLGVAILANALIVRMVLVPAIMHLMGNRAWSLPASLDRLLPRISVEAQPGAAVAADGSETAKFGLRMGVSGAARPCGGQTSARSVRRSA